MIGLARQLVELQTGDYDPADLKDRYETRLRTMLDGKIADQAVQPGDAPAPLDSNVIDLMAAHRKSLGGLVVLDEIKTAAKPARRSSKKALEPEVRTQAALKLPIKGGKPATQAKVEPATPPKAASWRRKAF